MPSKIKKRGENSYLLTVASGYDGQGKQICHTKTVTANSPREAEKQYGLFLAEIEKGQISTSGKMTLKQFFEYWEDNYAKGQHKEKTLVYNKNLFKRISETMGHMRLDKILPKHLLSFYANLAEVGIRQDPNATRRKIITTTENKPLKSTLSPNTVRKYHVLLHTLLEKATQWQLIAYNPADKVEPPKAQKTHKKIYDEETTGKFLLLLQNEELKYRLLAMLALSTGMRKGELYGLEWSHVDFTANTVHICQSSQYLPKVGIFTTSTKTEDSNRTITIPLSVIELLRQYKIQQNEERLKLGSKWQDSNRLFTTWDGKPAHPDSFYTWLRKFTIKNDLPHITPHSFRHMAATYLIVGGVDLRTVAGKLGHANSTTTQLIYSHLVKSAENETADMMETFIQTSKEKAKQKQKKQAN
ncbi:site-specific integrase [Pelosinus propionicus]|uniref:Site-specific recombinase XerD n=1 Tax=Pelosinus propionicus DSM 13327 TaxID=1123291 RepID=A0A1I4N7X1_9FIRM|nr:tyrosine-type recombinase/integrase [Pelosinus propionicus]SFM11495.1 Site-specific recombinase XerD [Pelosinus propionicus DSM 13327]